MSLGGTYGAYVVKLGYVWVFNINCAMLFVLIFYTAYVLPPDAPASAVGAIAGPASDITMTTLLKKYN